MTRARVFLPVLALLVAVGLPLRGAATAASAAPVCAPGAPAVELTGTVSAADAKTYRVLPVEVASGTTRIEVAYGWADRSPSPPSTPLTQTVLDLGLWDTDGYLATSGFRGWSGSRQGKLQDRQPPVWVQADAADRGYTPGTIDAGVWWVELGIAAVGPNGASWRVQVRCLDPVTGPPPVPDPVDAGHVARTGPGWYHGDFHLHAFHSSPKGPSNASAVEYARAAGLDFLPITEYVIGRHWDEWGATQRANPDLLIWPGREVITYFGHVNTIGETRNVLEYRHGFEGATIGAIQRQANADGALFQVNHPEFFPGPLFQNFCRGCEFTLGDQIDWDLVDTLEVLTGPILVDAGDIGGPDAGPQMQNPFVQPAIDLWEEQLRAGHRITAVSGSDDKLGPSYGSSVTAVYATELSRAGLTDGIRNGRAYVRTKGVRNSPTVELTAVAPDGSTGTIGHAFDAEQATVTVRVRGAANQMLQLSANGDLASVVPVTSNDFSWTFTADRRDGEGPLGTFWRVDTADAQSLTTIGNPIFLR